MSLLAQKNPTDNAHTDSVAAFVPDQSRAERKTSYAVDAFAVPGGREEEWRFTPVDRLSALFHVAPTQTDKVTVEVNATVAGTMVDLAVEEGATVQVGGVLCHIEGGAAGAAVAKPAAAPAAADPAGQLQLEIRPSADCWVSLTVDGRKLFARVMPAGEKQVFPVAKEATVEIGDAGAFAYSVNGKPGKSLGDKGQVRTLKITPATASQFIR